VTPLGDIVAIPQRGLFIGNRGITHDPATKTLLKKRWTTKGWLVCVLDYKGQPLRYLPEPPRITVSDQIGHFNRS
jgi:hypothetical protein